VTNKGVARTCILIYTLITHTHTHIHISQHTESQSVKMQFVAARTMDKDDPTASQISWSTIPSLAPGDSFTATPRFNFGSGHDLGPFQIWCYVDSDELLLELSKDNNRVGIELQLQDRDLNRNASDLVFHTAAIVQSEPYGELVAGNTIDFYGYVTVSLYNNEHSNH